MERELKIEISRTHKKVGITSSARVCVCIHPLGERRQKKFIGPMESKGKIISFLFETKTDVSVDKTFQQADTFLSSSPLFFSNEPVSPLF